MPHPVQKNLVTSNKARRQRLAYLAAHLPRFKAPTTPSSINTWLKNAPALRTEILDLFFRGHPKSILNEKPAIRWADRIPTGKGYTIRKLRYEGYPGLWVPALLYEPDNIKTPAPAVLNPNGHHHGGKAMDYKQARCINLAKRGMLALNTEFIGMGELRADAEHNRIGHLDICGVAGIGVFYLLMKRGLDVLLAHPKADPARIAMTGLSGGGWQTALLSALDERVKVVVPVAGHSPVWQRSGCMEDIGDQEQCPSDLCTLADYDALSALFAPRPTLLIYNRNDDCCFQTKRTRQSIYKPICPLFQKLGADLALHDNTDPGTHNYERDNRRQLYQFLDRHFGLSTSDDDLPWRDELLTEAELNVGLPADNATLHSLAQDALRKIRTRKHKAQSPAAARKQLAVLIKLPHWKKTRLEKIGAPQKRRDCTVQHYRLHLDGTWTLPLSECAPPRAKGAELILTDAGRRASAGLVDAALAQGRRVFAADIFGTGALAADHRHHMLIGTAGQRPLGIQVGQVLALLAAIGKRGAPQITASGQVAPIVALIAAALKPKAIAALTTHTLLDSLGRLVDWPLPYASAPSLYCFDLLRHFDIPDFIALSAPVPLADANRGPLRL